MRAKELIDEYLREGRLSANRSQPIGAGSYGTVYRSDEPGYVIKQNHPQRFTDDLEKETNLQAIAAELGIAPAIRSYERFPEGTQRIEMADASTNFEPRETLSDYPEAFDAVRVNQQLGQLALKGVDLKDRHNRNILYNKMTGRPTQIDFGIADRVVGEDQVQALAEATADGLSAAGIPSIASIYKATVFDLLAGGDVADAMDVAKQGFSRLQKITQPLDGATPKSLAPPQPGPSWL